VKAVLSPVELDAIEAHLARVALDTAGTRQLLVHPWCRDLAGTVRTHRALSHLIPPASVCAQCTLFEKSTGRNWLVPLHQDVHVPVRERVEHAELDGWSEKEGIYFVGPPIRLLEELVAVRLHIDPCGPDHGPLRIVPGSHRFGRLDERASVELRERCGEHVCTVERGDALVMKPLVLHASSKATRPNRRRVLHFLFGPRELTCGLRYAHAT
jgi:hypothetical protein